jgi:hypothetical protein
MAFLWAAHKTTGGGPKRAPVRWQSGKSAALRAAINHLDVRVITYDHMFRVDYMFG